MKSKNKQRLGSLILLLVSSVFALLLCEVGARLFLNPADYLSPTIIRDPILGIRLPAKSAGYD